MDKKKLIDVKELIKKFSIEELNASAEEMYAKYANDDYMLSKPYVSIEEAPNHLILLAILIKGLKLVRNMSVLDFGCGGGYTSRILNQLGCRVISCDVSETGLEYAKKSKSIHPVIGKQPEHTFLLFDGKKLDIESNSIDRVICMDSFHHVPNQEQIISEFSRILKKDGIAGFSEPGPMHSKSPEAQAQMKSHVVIENDIDTDWIYKIAKKYKFKEIRLALFSLTPRFLNQNDFNNILSKRTLPVEFNNDIILQLENQKTFYLCKSAYDNIMLDSSIKSGLIAKIDLTINKNKFIPNEEIEFTGQIQNISDKIWLPSGTEKGCVNIGIHIFNNKEQKQIYDLRSDLSKTKVLVNEIIKVKFKLKAPDSAGNYKLNIDLVSEYVSWFEWLGSHTISFDINVS